MSFSYGKIFRYVNLIIFSFTVFWYISDWIVLEKNSKYNNYFIYHFLYIYLRYFLLRLGRKYLNILKNKIFSFSFMQSIFSFIISFTFWNILKAKEKTRLMLRNSVKTMIFKVFLNSSAAVISESRNKQLCFN